MNGTLSPGLLVNVFGAGSGTAPEAGREELYFRNNKSENGLVSPVPKINKPGIGIRIALGRVRAKLAA
jgi:hypothetical protein